MRWDLSFFVYVLLVFLVVAAAAAAAVGTAGAAVPSSVLPFVPWVKEYCYQKVWRVLYWSTQNQTEFFRRLKFPFQVSKLWVEGCWQHTHRHFALCATASQPVEHVPRRCTCIFYFSVNTNTCSLTIHLYHTLDGY